MDEELLERLVVALETFAQSQKDFLAEYKRLLHDLHIARLRDLRIAEKRYEFDMAVWKMRALNTNEIPDHLRDTFVEMIDSL